jgi:TolB-like protein/DNA-binding winged helix-turn-helix (wHTH) protein
MNLNGQKREVLRFGTFELDLASRELRKGGALVKLQSQQLQLLTLLAERAGQVVSREEIRRSLWDDETFVDFDQSINFCVNKVRDALGDDPQSPRYIETVPRKGYRFIGFATPAVSKPIPARWLLGAGAAVMLLVAIALAATMGVSRQRGAKPIESLAVLPLENLSHDPEQDYFAVGLTDELITDLAKISALRVISRTSVMQYKGTKKPIPEIARELGVDAVLEGTVTRDQDRVRITAQLIRAAPEKHLWADKYERDMADVLKLEAEVARAIAKQIRIRATSDETARLASAAQVQPAAYEEYSRGRYHFWKNNSDLETKQAIQHFNRAIQLQPDYAAAYGLLSFAWHLRLGNGWVKPGEAGDAARRSALKAIDLDPNDPEAHVGLAGVHWFEDWDWAAADKEFRRALELDPNSMEACGCYIAFLFTTGRFPEAIAMGELSSRVDPYNAEARALHAGALYGARRYPEAVSLAQSAANLDPQNSDAYQTLEWAYEAMGNSKDALAAVDRDLFHDSALLAWAYARLGRRSDALSVLGQVMKSASDPQGIAQVYFALGDPDNGFKWLTRAFDERENFLSFVKFDPAFDNVRDDPRFRALVARLKLPD